MDEKNVNNDQLPFNAAVLVVGDLNRSPRMLNHCLALTEAFPNINEISLIGYNGGDIRSDIANNPKIKQYHIRKGINKFLSKLPRFLFILAALIKIILQTLSLTWILFRIPKFKFLILQNPPGIPSMLICWIICRLRGAKFIIDWHNYGYTILKVNNRPNFLVNLACKYEKYLGKKSDLNFCVSQAEKRDLKKEFNIDAICLPDRPVKGLFKFLNELEANDLYKNYPNELYSLIDTHLPENKNLKPIVMISSTSWTPDEDFSMLLDAFIKTEEMIKESIEDKTQKNIYNITEDKIKKILFLITGRGPMRDKFMDKVSEANLKYFDVKSIWLESDDYPKLLSLVDLGISLHYSSSGIDLPMKVVDMFSGCLPVASVYYETINELVKENENGFLFKNSKDLGKILKNVIIELSATGKCEKIIKFRENLHKELDKNDWVSQWKQRIPPALKKKNFI
jgi:beta-1,4-mannosyltransferase